MPEPDLNQFLSGTSEYKLVQMEEIINKVAGSGIISIDLEEFYVEGERIVFDIKPHLFMEQILKEKDFREFIKTNDWSVYKDKIVGIICSADAIVPTWAYMLITLALEPFAKKYSLEIFPKLKTYCLLKNFHPCSLQITKMRGL